MTWVHLLPPHHARQITSTISIVGKLRNLVTMHGSGGEWPRPHLHPLQPEDQEHQVEQVRKIKQ